MDKLAIVKDELTIIKDEGNYSEKDFCKGVFMRYRKESYFNGSSIVFKDKFSILKKLSCSGCIHCGIIYDLLNEDLEYIQNIPNDLENGDTISCTLGEYKDYYGEVDVWLDFTKVK